MKSRTGLAVLVVAAALSSTAQARGLHLGFPFGGFGSALSHLLPGGHHRHSYARVRMANAMGASARADNNGPTARGRIAAATALAGWHGGRDSSGWWRHAGGGYGWVGPLFWPFAFHDIYDYTVRGSAVGFWDYGYGDIYAAIFAPYGSDELASYSALARDRGRGKVVSLERLCDLDGSEGVDLSVDRIRQVVQPDEEQRAALDDFAKASNQAARTIRAACPTRVALTAAGRLAATQERIETLISAVAQMRPPLEKFYELLDDEQKGRLNALAPEPNADSTSGTSPARRCANMQTAAFRWPSEEIGAGLQLNEAQRAALDVLRGKSARANDVLKDGCKPVDALTPPDRLAAADTRLDAMLEAIKLVRPALEDFYAKLSDEQKAGFEAIGPRRTG